MGKSIWCPEIYRNPSDRFSNGYRFTQTDNSVKPSSEGYGVNLMRHSGAILSQTCIMKLKAKRTVLLHNLGRDLAACFASAAGGLVCSKNGTSGQVGRALLLHFTLCYRPRPFNYFLCCLILHRGHHCNAWIPPPSPLSSM